MFKQRILARVLVLLAVSQGLSGCGERRTATTASSPISPSTPPAAGSTQVRGHLSDTAFRPIGGATVQVVDGPDAGVSTITNDYGTFTLTGRFDVTTQFRAIKDGYSPSTSTARYYWQCERPGWLLYFSQSSVATPVDITGDYTLTFIADSSCTALPDEFRTRSYAATIAPDSSNPASPPGTSYSATFSGASFLDVDRDQIPIGISGPDITFLLDDEALYLSEEVAPHTYLAFFGRPSARVETPSVSTISTAFEGLIDYCAQDAPIGYPYVCSSSRHLQCLSHNHRLILTRR